MNIDSTNPLLNWSDRPPFDKFDPSQVVSGIDTMLEACESALQELESSNPSTWDDLVHPIEQIEDFLSRTWGVVSHLNSVKNSPELREAYETAQPKVVAFGNKMGQSRPIYDAFCRLGDSDAWDSFDSGQKRIIEKSIEGARLSGVSLDGAEKERFNEISEKLAQLTTKFSNNVLDATKAYELLLTEKNQLEGLPESYIQMAADTAVHRGHEGATAEDGPWAVTLDFPSYVPFMKNSPHRELREQIYKAYVTRASDGDLRNQEVAQEILKLKMEKANLLGYKNHADLSLSQKMAGTVDAVDKLLKDLKEAATPAGERDLADLAAIAKEHGAPEADDLQQWDIFYWSEKLRESKFDINEEELRAYFPFERVLDGMFELVNRIFAIQVVSADGDVPVWHEDVRYFRVLDETGQDIAAFYLDPFSRPSEKRGGAWAFPAVQRSTLLAGENESVRIPVAYMCCNQSPPVGDTPSLMTLREVETLFHEFGHDLQHMLTEIDRGLNSGLAMIEWDAIEIASQFMENWIYHKPTLKGLSGHYQTGEPLSEEMLDKIIAARSFRAGYAMLRQVNFGRFDMELHARHQPGSEDIGEIQDRIFRDTLIMEPTEKDMFYCAFGHIFAGGYSAGYFSYKWSEVLSADAFAAFTEVGLENEEAVKEVGMRYRKTILARGGSQHPMDVYKEFRGREPSIEPLLKQDGLI